MTRPKALNPNGTIAFVATSHGCENEPYITQLKNAKLQLEKKGFKVICDSKCFKNKGVCLSDTPENVANEFMKYYLSDENSAIISVSGGELMCEILEYIDFEKIREAKPKWYMGFSDNTNLTFLLTTLCGIITIYGPCGISLSRPWGYQIEKSFELMENKTNIIKGQGPDKEKNVIYGAIPNKNFEIEGILLGGCMDVIINLIGTKFDKIKEYIEDYKEDGIIWFLEACDLQPFSIRRAFWQMKMSGCFKYVKGFLIGKPVHHDICEDGVNQYNAAVDIIGDLGVPILLDCDFGHVHEMIPILCGAKCKVEYVSGELSFRYE